jgi:zinc protease
MLDARGIALRTWVTRHTFTISCLCLAEDFEDVLALAAEIAIAPSFPSEEIDKRRIEAVTSVRHDDDNPFVRAGDALMEMLYGADHPYGRPVKGTLDSLEAIGRSDLLEYHRRWLTPRALRLAIVGDVAVETATSSALRAFGGPFGPPREVPIVRAPVARTRDVRVIPMPGKPQTDIAYGFTSVRRLDPRFYAYWMMNTVFGQFGLGGRLADNIRERQGMAYYAYSTLEATVAEGPLVVRAGVDPNNVERTLEAIDAEVRLLAADGPNAREFADTRDFLVGSIPRMLETNESIAEFLQTAEQFGLGLDYDRQLPGLLERVTLDQVVEAAREVLDPSKAAVAVAGPHVPAGLAGRLSTSAGMRA